MTTILEGKIEMKKKSLDYIFFLLYKLGSKQEKLWAEYYAGAMISFFISISLYATNFWIVNVCKLLSKDFYLAKPYLYVVSLFFFFILCFFKFIYKKRFIDIERKYDPEWLSLTKKQRRKILIKHFWPTIVVMIYLYLGISVGRYLNGFGFF